MVEAKIRPETHPPETESAIALHQVRFAYGQADPVFEDVSFSIQPGQRVGLIGHNGCGKTTLFMLLCGVLKPTAGEISLLNRPVIPGQFRPDVGMLFQDPSDQLFSPSVRDDIAFGPENMGLDPAEVAMRVEQAMEITGIGALAERPPHHLSGGEKQMVAMAGLLAMRPQILLCDEPTASLDMRTRRRLIGFLQRATETLLVASHDLEFVLEVCDRVLLIDDGQLIADGDPATIMGNSTLMETHGLEKPHSLTPHTEWHHRRLPTDRQQPADPEQLSTTTPDQKRCSDKTTRSVNQSPDTDPKGSVGASE